MVGLTALLPALVGYKMRGLDLGIPAVVNVAYRYSKQETYPDMSPSFLLVAFAVVLCGIDAASLQRYRRQALPEDDANYLTELYNRFRNDRNLNFEGWRQFAIMVVNRPDNLVPCPLDINVMNDVAGDNYVAFTPVDINVGRVHAETRALGTLAYYVHHNNPTRIYLFTYLSPCQDCTNEIVNMANTYTGITFYIGYIRQFNQGAANYALQRLGGLRNVYYSNIAPANPPCHDKLRRKRSNTCPVVSCGASDGGGGGYFPSTAIVQTNDLSSPTKTMDELKVGDEVLVITAKGNVVFSPVIAFHERLPSVKAEFVIIKTEDHHTLQLSPLHLIFYNGSAQPVMATAIQPGDYVYTVDPEEYELPVNKRESKVVSVYKVNGIGAYAPLTMEGTVIVDGVVASCYAADQKEVHWYANLLRDGVQYTRKYILT